MAEDQRRGRRGGVDSSVRTSAVWDSVRDLVTRRSGELGRPLRVVDLGGGTGGLAVPIAALGHHVTVVDPSPDALAALDPPGRRRRRRRPGGRRPGRRRRPCSRCTPPPTPTWSAATARSRSSTTPPRPCAPSLPCSPTAATLSLLVAQRLAVVLARALSGQFAQARHALTSDGRPLGPGRPAAAPVRRGRRRRPWSARRGSPCSDSHGVRIFSDLVPSAFIDSEADRAAPARARAGAPRRHPDYAFLGQLGAALHVLARRA